MTSFAPIPLSPTQPPHLSLRPDERPYETRDLPSSPPRHYSSHWGTGYARSTDQSASQTRTSPLTGGQSAGPTPLSPSALYHASLHPRHSRPSAPVARPSFIDEILPTPSSSAFSSEKMRGLPITNDSTRDAGTAHCSRTEFTRLLRRSGSIGVIFCFLLVASWMAATDTGGKFGAGLREALGAGRLGVQEISLGATRQGNGYGHEQAQGAGAGAHGHGHGLGYGQVETDDDMSTEKSKPDYDQYIMLRTLPSDMISTETTGRRVIIVGDIHGSFKPLQNLLSKLYYSPSHDTLLHVGDLLAKGPLPNAVLDYMSAQNAYGVRGNHDQPVVRWRAWMEHAGGMGWREMMDQVGRQSEKDAREYFERKGKGWERGWEWKGEHWEIARSLTDKQYQYLLSLPLALHIPSIHSVIVHAGLVPYDLHKSPNDPSQPLIIADKEASKGHEASESDEADTAKEGGETDWSQYADDDSDAPISHSDGQEGDKPDAHGHGRPATPRPAKGPSTDAHGHGHSSALDVSSWIDDDADAPSLLSRGKSRIPRDRDDQSQSRLNTELAILTHLPQNRAPYTLTDMRSLYTHGKKRGKITKSSKKGQPWAEVWNGQMGRCEGVGRWGWGEESGEGVDVEYARDGDEEGDGGEGEVEGESKKGLRCSPFTVIYGHAAGRGLDIRPFSKGIDTGCVYGQKLTALVLGDTKGLKGKSVQVDKHKGVLVHVDCKSGGTG